MGKKILITENQLKRLVQTISEEAAGYDDFEIMRKHGGKSMSVLIDTLSDLSNVLEGIVNMTNSSNIEYVDLKENLDSAIELISEIMQVMNIVFKDFTESKTIRKGEILHRKLESYQEKIRMMINMDEELISKENLINKLNELTENLGKYTIDYANELQSSHKRFSKRVNIGKPRPKID